MSKRVKNCLCNRLGAWSCQPDPRTKRTGRPCPCSCHPPDAGFKLSYDLSGHTRKPDRKHKHRVKCVSCGLKRTCTAAGKCRVCDP